LGILLRDGVLIDAQPPIGVRASHSAAGAMQAELDSR
jgi:hypothetical protein